MSRDALIDAAAVSWDVERGEAERRLAALRPVLEILPVYYALLAALFIPSVDNPGRPVIDFLCGPKP